MTGGAGYFGSILVGTLLQENYEVKVLDSLMFGGSGLASWWGDQDFEFIKGDVGNKRTLLSALRGVEAVVHLAALVGEPLCKKYPEVALKVNREATFELVDQCKEADVPLLVYASTCSNYGAREPNELADEDSSLDPISLYSKTKVEGERYVLEASTQSDLPLTGVVLRFATLYGVSPSMRWDLLLHDLVRDAMTKREVEIFGAEHWRPLLHVRDASEACVLALQCPRERLTSNAFNVGRDDSNMTKKELGDMVVRHFPGTNLKASEERVDPRNYRVSFKRIASVLGFSPKRTVEQGIEELKQAFDAGAINPANERRFSV